MSGLSIITLALENALKKTNCMGNGQYIDSVKTFTARTERGRLERWKKQATKSLGAIVALRSKSDKERSLRDGRDHRTIRSTARSGRGSSGSSTKSLAKPWALTPRRRHCAGTKGGRDGGCRGGSTRTRDGSCPREWGPRAAKRTKATILVARFNMQRNAIQSPVVLVCKK